MKNDQELLKMAGVEGFNTMEGWISALERESQEFRRGVKTAMLENGRSEEDAEALFKLAESLLLEKIAEGLDPVTVAPILDPSKAVVPGTSPVPSSAPKVNYPKIGPMAGPGEGEKVWTPPSAPIAAPGAPAVGAGKGFLQSAKETLGLSAKTDDTGMAADRNRLLPFMNNSWAGAGGGVLMGALASRQLGLNGPLGWLLPVLGGVAGYKYFPQLMNRMRDPLGKGVNAVPGVQRSLYQNMFATK